MGNKADDILGVHLGSSLGGNIPKEFLKLGKKDDAVTSGLIRGNLSSLEAAYLDIIYSLAPNDKGTSEAILHYIASGLGTNGHARFMALMANSDTMVPEWGLAFTQQDNPMMPKSSRDHERDAVQNNGHNGHHAEMTGGYNRR